MNNSEIKSHKPRKAMNSSVEPSKSYLILLTLTSAFFLPLALSNDIHLEGNPVIALFCLIPFFYALYLAPGYKYAAKLGALFGGVNTFLTYYWLMFFGEFSIWTTSGVILAYTFFGYILGPYLYGAMQKYPAYRVLTLTLVWISYEYMKSDGFLAFPWGLLAHPFHRILPLVQIADITGVWGVSFLIVFFNALMTDALIRKILFTRETKNLFSNSHWNRQALSFLLLLGISLIYGAIRLATPVPVEKEIRVLLVQQNRDPWAEGNSILSIYEGMELTREGMKELSQKPHIIAWSETSFHHDLINSNAQFERYPPDDPLLPFIREQGAYFLAGAPYFVSSSELMNTAVLLDKKGSPRGHYGKMHPVPFAEYIPLWNIPLVKKFFMNVIGLGGIWTTGTQYSLFNLPLEEGKTFRFGAPICFEDSFPDLCRQFIKEGGEGWINLTNVSWSSRESAEYQMYVAAIFRSIENRRVLIRSTNSGVTSIIDAYGKTLAALPMFEQGYLHADVPIQVTPRMTVYTAWGDYFPKLLTLIVFCLFIYKEIQRRRKEKQPFLLNDPERMV